MEVSSIHASIFKMHFQGKKEIKIWMKIEAETRINRKRKSCLCDCYLLATKTNKHRKWDRKKKKHLNSWIKRIETINVDQKKITEAKIIEKNKEDKQQKSKWTFVASDNFTKEVMEHNNLQYPKAFNEFAY